MYSRAACHRGLRVGIAFVVLSCTCLLSGKGAAVPQVLNYQGYLADGNHVPRTGPLPMSFALYADSVGGAPLWSEAYAAVIVNSGVFAVALGSVAPLPPVAFDGSVLWLETAVQDSVFLPRRPLTSVPYAFRAAVADSAPGQTGGHIAAHHLEGGKQTTSTDYVQYDVLSITTSGRPLLILFDADCKSASTASALLVDLRIDGDMAYVERRYETALNHAHSTIALHHYAVLPAGSHTVEVMYRSSAGAAVYMYYSSFTVIEL